MNREKWLNRYFAMFIAVCTVAFTATVLVTEAVGAPTVAAVAIGVMLDSFLLEPLADLFAEWHRDGGLIDA